MIDAGATINSGQVFLWDRRGDVWYGINGQDVLAVTDSGRTRSYMGRRPDFFRRRDDGKKGVAEAISRDARVRRAARAYPGLRITDQDPFQCLVSFIISSNSSIQKIRSCLGALCLKLGERAEFDGREFALFPDAGRLAGAAERQIRACGAGYRAGYVRAAARMVRDGRLDLAALRRASYADAMEGLAAVPGVGSKVADCVMLYSLDKPEAFPLDRWMMRILGRYGGRFATGTRTLTEKQYGLLHGRIVEYYGPYAGYAQQLLFKAERDGLGKGWL